VAAIELAGHQAAAVSPIEQTVAATLGDTVELRGQVAEIASRIDACSHTVATWKPRPGLVALKAIVRPTREES
jgi:hypothetical protein